MPARGGAGHHGDAQQQNDGSKGVEIFVDAPNLTNTMYVSNVGVFNTANAASPLYNPGDGISIYAGGQAKF